jgi:hypothetical protein
MTKTHKPGRSTERLGQFPGLSTEEKQKIQKQLNLRTTTMLVVLLLEKTKVPSKNPPLYSPPVEDLHLLQDGLAAKLFEENSQGKIIRSTPKELLAVFWDPIFAMESAGRFINQIKPPFGQGPVPGYKISLSLGQVKSGHSSTGQGLEEDLMGHCLNQVYEMNRMSDPGRILISETLRDLLLPWIAKEPFYVFTTHGNYQLEGQKNHLEVYEFGLSQNRIVPPLKSRKKIPRLPRWFFLLLFAGLGYLVSIGVEALRDFYAHPTVYFYDFRSDRLVLDDQYELFLDDTETEGKKRLNNQITPGRHSLSVNQGGRRTRIYYLFDVVPGVNNFRPEFTEYTLPEYQSAFTYSAGKRSFEDQKTFDYTVINQNLEEEAKSIAVEVDIKGELGGRQPPG